MQLLLSPSQLGFGVPHGLEAAVHAGRAYLSSMVAGNAMLKLDFRKAFSTLRRDKMLEAVLDKAPSVFPLAHCAYSTHSFLYYGQRDVIISSEGVQQGDPLGPLLFCLAIHDLVAAIQTEFSVFYLDDGTLSGPVDCVMSALTSIEDRAQNLGLELNHSKSELICVDNSTKECILSSFPLLKITDPEDAIKKKISNLKLLGERIKEIQAHNALCLLRSAFTLPRLLFLIRTASCFQSHLLAQFDLLLRHLLESLCNISLDDTSWTQASLPINSGGLGIRSAFMLASCTFLASAAGSEPLSLAILPEHFTSVNPHLKEKALSHWKQSLSSPNDTSPPSGLSASV